MCGFILYYNDKIETTASKFFFFIILKYETNFYAKHLQLKEKFELPDDTYIIFDFFIIFQKNNFIKNCATYNQTSQPKHIR